MQFSPLTAYKETDKTRIMYNDFIKKHNRTFANEREYEKKYNNFVKTLKKIDEKNNENMGQKFGPNKYADFSVEEYNKATTFHQKVDKELMSSLNSNLNRLPEVLSMYNYAQSYNRG